MAAALTPAQRAALAGMPLAPPPPGVVSNLDFSGPGSKSLALHLPCIIVAFLFFATRAYTRGVVLRSLGWDDALLAFAWANSIVFSAFTLQSAALGFGRHMWDIPFLNIFDLYKYISVVELLYIPLVATLKASFFLTFLRIFGRQKHMTILCWFGLAATSVTYIAIIIATVLNCHPVAKLFNVAAPGSCGSLLPIPVASGVFNIISDVYIVVIPMFPIYGLQMPLKKKIRIGLVFSLGLFCCATSITRLIETVRHIRDVDAFHSAWPVSVWAVLEVTVGIIAASCLVMTAFIEKVARPMFATISSRTYMIPRLHVGVIFKSQTGDVHSYCSCSNCKQNATRLGSSYASASQNSDGSTLKEKSKTASTIISKQMSYSVERCDDDMV